MIPNKHIGLRAVELEIGIATNVDPASSGLVDFEVSRVIGQAARLAMLIRGQDVIEDERRLKMIAARELRIAAAEYNAAKRVLQDVDLLDDREVGGKVVLYEKIERLDHGANYERLGSLWVSRRDRTEKEEALLSTLDRIVDAPADPSTLASLTGLPKDARGAVLEVGKSACVLDVITGSTGPMLFSPLLWDVDPSKVGKVFSAIDGSKFRDIVTRFSGRPGTDLTRELDTVADELLVQAVRGGILPSYRVRSAGGERVYGFTPYAGRVVTTPEQKIILDKARAIVACLRYGSEAASASRIRNPVWILGAMMDASRGYSLKPHSEARDQYGMLVSKGIGRVTQVGERYAFALIPTKDNLLACSLAMELIEQGEVVGDKDPYADAAADLMTGTVGNPLHEVSVAKQKRTATSDELADLVDKVRGF